MVHCLSIEKGGAWLSRGYYRPTARATRNVWPECSTHATEPWMCCSPGAEGSPTDCVQRPRCIADFLTATLHWPLASHARSPMKAIAGAVATMGTHPPTHDDQRPPMAIFERLPESTPGCRTNQATTRRVAALSGPILPPTRITLGRRPKSSERSPRNGAASRRFIMVKSCRFGVVMSLGLLPLLAVAGCGGEDSTGSQSSSASAQQACLETHTDHGICSFAGTQRQVCGASRLGVGGSLQLGGLLSLPAAQFGLSFDSTS